jgi:pimeloyl-ACP methyl ester carboxylesterase
MTSMANNSRPTPRLSRDSQQWFFDWMIQETGKTFHFQTEGRGRLPRAVRRHAMISKHMGRSAQRMQRLAEEEAAAGHETTALARYFDAATLYGHAQHPIFENNEEKKFLHSASLECFAHVRRLAPYRIEHVDFEWNGATLSGNLHLCSTEEPAPCVLYIPGCDQTKEMHPNPLMNQALQRGMHLFSFDGPGQGESNLRGVKLTATNYEEAGSAAIDYLLTRPEIDAAKIGVYGFSYGSRWGMRLAARDSRVAALAATLASFGESYHLMDEESPRWKQLFMYLTGAGSEAELDRIMAATSLRGVVKDIQCPTLAASGEYDPRSPLEEVYELFDELTCPAELWVFADLHHALSLVRPNGEGGPIWQWDMHDMACDWLRDRFEGRSQVNRGKVLYIDPGVGGPYSPKTSEKRHWYEADSRQAQV